MTQTRSTLRKPNKPGAGGKLANDVNKVGMQNPTQKNLSRRTPMSRADRLTLRGADNQTQSRKTRSLPPSQGGLDL